MILTEPKCHYCEGEPTLILCRLNSITLKQYQHLNDEDLKRTFSFCDDCRKGKRI